MFLHQKDVTEIVPPSGDAVEGAARDAQGLSAVGMSPLESGFDDGALEVRGVTVRFGGVVAVDGVDLTLRPGEIVGLIGPNGAGKSTFVNAVTGYVRMVSGVVRLCGREIGGLSAERVAGSGLGRTFQSGRVFGNLTVRENVEAASRDLWRRRVTGRRVGDLLELVGLSGRGANLARALPHGEAHKLGIARALAVAKLFLLLDEPAAGLNDSESAELVEVLLRIRSEMGLGLLVIEHDMSVIDALCERIQVIDQGRTIASGPAKDVRSDPAVLTAYLGTGAARA